MRNHGLIADATREKVMIAVRALGYVPNRIAGSLVSLDSRLVGVVIPSLSNIVFAEILQGINAGLAGTNRQSVSSVTDYDLDREEDVVRNLLAWQPAAVLIVGQHIRQEQAVCWTKVAYELSRLWKLTIRRLMQQ